MAERPTARIQISSESGYHSPQLDVDIRLNTNESPFPPPPGFVEAVARAALTVDWNRYPDRSARHLRSALAQRYDVTPEQVFAANGSNEVLQSLLLAYGGEGRSVAVFEPTYAMYSQIARTTGTRLVKGRRAADFSLDSSSARQLVLEERPDVVILCSPNNPTGTPAANGLVVDLEKAVGSYGGLLVLDEAYGEFAPEGAAGLVSEDRCVVVSRTFSKTWAMAGARLGYLIAPTWCVAELEKVALPYHLDALKLEIGVLALGYVDAMRERVERLVAERERMATALDGLEVTTWPSAANFILLRPDSRPGREVWQDLVERSVLVRDFTTMPGLEECLRVTIGSRVENDMFLDALREVLR